MIPIFFGLVSIPAQAQTGNGKELKEEILGLINQHRAKKHLPPLELNKEVGEVCEKHSKNMGNDKVAFGHIGFDDREKELQKTLPHNKIAENVAQGKLDAAKVVKLWLNSKPHRKNIEGDYDTAGIGLGEGKDGEIFFTMIFLKKK